MKIRKLRLKNINSLYGEWEVDFTIAEYVSSGIFAIVGPTGAGKSTLLDAVSLALYGRTPRLNVISASTNELMAKGTGDCAAEVCFEVEGEVYSAHWSQRRSRSRAEGKLQSYRHILDNVTTGKVVSEKVAQTRLEIEALIGMNFEQFSRSMLLAQGEFAKFLQASTAERSDILERITDTAVYTNISKAVHERKKIEAENLVKLQAGIDGVYILNREEKMQLQTEFASVQEQEVELSRREEILRQIKTKLERLRSLEAVEVELRAKSTDLANRRESWKDDLLRLEGGERVQAVWAEYERLQEGRVLQEQEQQVLRDCQQQLHEFIIDLEVVGRARDAGRSEAKRAREEYEQEQVVQRRVQVLDHKLAAVTHDAQRLGARAAEVRAYFDKLGANIEQVEAELKRNLTRQQDLGQYFEGADSDRLLATELELIVDSLRMVSERTIEAMELQAEFGVLQDEYAQAEVGLQVVKSEKDRLLSESSVLQEGVALRQTAVDTILAGSTAVALEYDLSVLQQRQDSLRQLLRLKASLDKAAEELATLHTRREQVQAESEFHSGKQEKLGFEQESLEREVEHLELELRLVDKIKTLSERRDELVPGEACPLCGSPEHPFVVDGVPQDDLLLDKLKAAKDMLKEVNTELSASREELATLTSRFGSIQERREQLVSLQADLAGERDKLLDTLEPERRFDSVEELDAEVDIVGVQVDTARQRLEKYRQTEMELTRKQQEYQMLQERRLRCEEEHNRKEASFLAIKAKLDALTQRLAQAEASRDELGAGLQSRLKKYGYAELVVAEITAQSEAITFALQRRLAEYTTKKTELEGLRRDEEIAVTKLAEYTSGRRREEQIFTEVSAELAEIQSELEGLRLERLALYGQKDPDSEELRWKERIQSLEESIEQRDREYARVDKCIAEYSAKVETSQETIARRTGELSNLETGLVQSLHLYGFQTEQEMLAAKLDPSELSALREIREQLTVEEEQLRQRQVHNTREREGLLAQLQDETDSTEVEARLEALLVERSAAAQRIGALKSRLESDSQAGELLAQKQEALRRQQDICRKWGNLHELIGSAEGTKFRNFAQGLTFDIMLKYANLELRVMSERYLLVRAGTQNPGAELLGIEVIDKDQAGLVRSVKNLSGGESFIVSLALALGLSKMSSKKVVVASLFLDEGFGTLDEDELDKVLSALARIQQQGKLIGVISHVSALKERIGLQLTLEKCGGGRSIISGPGCRRI